MAANVISVPVTKGKSAIDLDIDALPDEVYKEILIQGAKVLLNRGMSKITKASTKDEAEMNSLAMAAAEKNLEAMKAGKIKFSGKKAKKASGEVMTEARRLARNLVKDALREAGQKISHIEASEITKAANELIENDPSLLEQAAANVAARAEKVKLGGIGIDLSSIKISDKLVEKANAKKAKDGTLSATQAGKPKAKQPKAKPTATVATATDAAIPAG